MILFNNVILLVTFITYFISFLFSSEAFEINSALYLLLYILEYKRSFCHQSNKASGLCSFDGLLHFFG